jgi:hypothetical protein
MAWPISDLLLLIGTSYARSPKSRLMASVSVASLIGVDVPWALI